MKRRLLFVLLVVVLALLSVFPALAQDDQPVALTLFTTESDPPQLQALAKVIDAYHEMHPNVYIDVVTGTPATRGDRVRTLLTAGADIGIFELEPAFASQWAEAGLLLPLTDVYDANGGADNYVQGSVFQLNGEVYGLPYATSVYGLWYRTDLFEEAGLTPPTNYDELLTVAAALTKPDAGVYGLAIPGATNASVSYFSTFLWNNCLDYYTPDGTLLFGDPANLEAVKRWTALAQYAPPGFEGWSFGDQITAFITGSSAMVMYAGRLGARMPDQAPQLESVTSIVKLPWSYTPDSPYVTYGNWSRYAIAASTAHPDVAKDFLGFFLSGDRLASYDATVLGHMVPPLNDVATIVENWDSDYAHNHSDWLAFFNENAQFINHPANNMGSVQACSFHSVNYGPPWGGPIFSTGGIIDTMLQSIYFGADPEEAWNTAVAAMTTVQETWLADHPNWAPPGSGS
ncbi:MAG: sugar ABC transporter substrate-binding protein [Anaerolineae bacterium]|nr:sugar ABC transporter substrate-binding protein [Anaerolineae bacterium]